MLSTIFNILSNLSFFTLFLTMLLYWLQTSFNTEYMIGQRVVARQTMWIAHIALACLLVLRWVQSGHFPLSNLYESCLFLSWALTLGHLALEINATSSGFRELGVFTAPIALFVYSFATLSLPPSMQEVAPLVPALRSHWLMMHVSLMILSYAALLCGSVLSIVFLVVRRAVRPSSEPLGRRLSALGQLPPEGRHSELDSLATILDTLSYRTLGIGFPLLTIGILSGAVWANEAWGSYWSWDPKETWALITWLVFAIYLHSRLTYGWIGEKPALIASLGFLVIWICYLGVNLMGKGLHSYGWLS